MKYKIMILGILLIAALVLVSCTMSVPSEETDSAIDAVEDAIVDTDLADIDENPIDDTDAAVADELVEETIEETEGTEELVADEEVEETVEEVEETALETVTNEEVITVEVNENELVDLNAVITDPDEDEVTYYFSEPLTAEGIWQTNYGDAGEYDILLTATDGVNTVEQLILLVINRVNVAPIIESFGDMGLLGDVIFKEGDKITFDPVVTDPNGDEVTVSVSAPLNEGVFQTDHNSAGEYEITVIATDGELSSETTFTLTIEDVNVLPEIIGLEDIEVNEGETVTLDFEVTDLDGDKVNVSISNPVGDDGVWDVSFTENGEYEVTVTVSDGKDVVEEKILIVVNDVNMPPEIVDVSLGTE